MRAYIVLIVTIALVLGFDFWGQHQLQTVSSHGTTLADEAYEAVAAEDWGSAQETARLLQDYYNNKEVLLAILVQHDQIEQIQSAVFRLSSMAAVEDKHLALMVIDELRQGYENLAQHVEVNWKNIIAAPPSLPLLPL